MTTTVEHTILWVFIHRGDGSMDDDGDDDDNDGDDNNDDDNDSGLVVSGLSGGLRMQMEKRKADGGVRGQKDNKRNGGTGHRPGYASTGHIRQRLVSHRTTSEYFRGRGTV